MCLKFIFAALTPSSLVDAFIRYLFHLRLHQQRHLQELTAGDGGCQERSHANMPQAATGKKLLAQFIPIPTVV